MQLDALKRMGGAVCAGEGAGFSIGSVTLFRFFTYEQHQSSEPWKKRATHRSEILHAVLLRIQKLLKIITFKLTLCSVQPTQNPLCQETISIYITSLYWHNYPATCWTIELKVECKFGHILCQHKKFFQLIYSCYYLDLNWPRLFHTWPLRK